MKIGDYELQVPFVTTSTDHIKTILEFAELKTGTKAVDLGSGDGRVVLEFAKNGAQVTGLEIKPELVVRSRLRIQEQHLSVRAKIHEKSFWDADLSGFDVVYIYGMDSILRRLEKKLERELRPGTKVISNVFRFPTWRIKKTKNFVHLYIVT